MIYRPLQDIEIDELGALITESFNAPEGVSRPWIERSGLPNWRIISDSNELLGGAMRIPMAQWFGGQAVTMTGLAGVIVSPRARGRGVGQKLIGNALAEMRESGTALSTLYGSTTSFYRQCGYERAGAAYELDIHLKELSSRAGPLEIRTLTSADNQTVEKLQHDWVRDQACLKRGPYLWHRVRNPKGKPADCYGFFRGEELEGYVFWKRSSFRGSENDLQITDLVLTTARAHKTFLGYLAGHRAMFEKATWTCPSTSSLLLALDEPWNYEMRMREHWMLRLLDVEKAFTERGYPKGLSGELHFEIEDPMFSENRGSWTLSVSDQKGHFERGGQGSLKLDIGALASMYSGFLTASQLTVAGRLNGPETQVSLANVILQGEPRLCDFF